MQKGGSPFENQIPKSNYCLRLIETIFPQEVPSLW